MNKFLRKFYQKMLCKKNHLKFLKMLMNLIYYIFGYFLCLILKNNMFRMLLLLELFELVFRFLCLLLILVSLMLVRKIYCEPNRAISERFEYDKYTKYQPPEQQKIDIN